MAANKFATMLHRKTNKITLILIYAALEWTLIVLLLLNSLFSYLIIKFAEYFGLKPPCLWCSRVDHLFEPGKKKNVHRDLLCHAHAAEISKLGYCLNHQKLAESQDMCEDCLSSRPESQGMAKNLSLFPWMKDIKMVHNGTEKGAENGEVNLECSCCGVKLDDSLYSPYIVIKPSWDVLEYTQKGNLITETGENDYVHDFDQIGSDSTTDRCEDEHGIENKSDNQVISDVNAGLNVTEEDGSVFVSVGDESVKVDVSLEAGKEFIEEKRSTVIMTDKSVQVSDSEDAGPEILPQHLEFFVDCSGHRLVPVELVDSTTEEDQSKYQGKDEDQDNDEANMGSEEYPSEEAEMLVENGSKEVEEEAVASMPGNEEEPKFVMLEAMELEEDENSLVFYAKECYPERETHEQFANVQISQIPFTDDEFQAIMVAEGEEKDADVHPDTEEAAQIAINETEADVSIGTEIPDLDITEEIQNHETLSLYTDTHDGPSTSSTSSHIAEDHGSEQGLEATFQLNTIAVVESEPVMNNQTSFCLDLNEIEEDKVPDTPTSSDSLHNLHKKLLLLEKRDSGTEESLDGSVASELDGVDGVTTMERLKAALRSERKTLHALYAELEEERSASAVAASQTMAMINRLQEEKAAMQMEALQYQRMMEEQSEYDQEALQLLNELMVKREREKQELEKELEIYRKKVTEYETKEKMKMVRKSKDGSTRSAFSSASCSNAEDSDGLSIDLNQEAKEEDGLYGHQECSNHNTPVDAVLSLEESLADFEEERMAILEQLKVLEEKLMKLDGEEGQHFEDVGPIEDFPEVNGKHINEHVYTNGQANGHTNGVSHEINGKHHPEKRTMVSKGKSLLPLFDAISDENGDIILNGQENGFESNGVHDDYSTNFEIESRKVAVEEELDHLHERLQALEADREFLKHCISSLKKGDKGMDLLQEILQHLRDLRNVELRVRNLSDGVLV